MISSCLRVILGINGHVLVSGGCSGADVGGGWEVLVVAPLKVIEMPHSTPKY